MGYLTQIGNSIEVKNCTGPCISNTPTFGIVFWYKKVLPIHKRLRQTKWRYNTPNGVQIGTKKTPKIGENRKWKFSFGKKLSHFIGDYKYVKTHGQCISLTEKIWFPYFLVLPYRSTASVSREFSVNTPWFTQMMLHGVTHQKMTAVAGEVWSQRSQRQTQEVECCSVDALRTRENQNRTYQVSKGTVRSRAGLALLQVVRPIKIRALPTCNNNHHQSEPRIHLAKFYQGRSLHSWSANQRAQILERWTPCGKVLNKHDNMETVCNVA